MKVRLNVGRKTAGVVPWVRPVAQKAGAAVEWAGVSRPLTSIGAGGPDLIHEIRQVRFEPGVAYGGEASPSTV